MRRVDGRRQRLVLRLAAVCAVGAATVGGQAALSATGAAASVGDVTVNIPAGATQVNIVDGVNGTEVDTGGTGGFTAVTVQAAALHVTALTPAVWTINNPHPFMTSLITESEGGSGAGGDTYNLVTTAAPTTILNGTTTNPDTFNLATTTSKALVVGTTGNDTFNVTSVSGELDPIGGGGSDSVNFGRQVVASSPEPKTLDDIRGIVQLSQGSGGHMSVALDDTAHNVPTVETFDVDQGKPIVSLPNNGFVVSDSSVNNLRFDGGTAGNFFIVKATSPRPPSTPVPGMTSWLLAAPLQPARSLSMGRLGTTPCWSGIPVAFPVTCCPTRSWDRCRWSTRNRSPLTTPRTPRAAPRRSATRA